VQNVSVKTPEQVKAQFRREGKTFKDFATENKYPYGEVVRVVNGINKARRGRGHEIAVRLGLKEAA
jgi:gp16 family phage-associated protein